MLKFIISFLMFIQISLAKQETVRSIGDFFKIAVPAAALLHTHLNDDWDGTQQFLFSITSTVAATELLKRNFPDLRPDGSDYRAVVSGHTSATFSSASFIHFRYGFKHAILPYLAASFTAYSRIESKRHDFDDVAYGFLLGTFSSYVFTSSFNQGGLDLKLTPQYKGISFQFNL